MPVCAEPDGEDGVQEHPEGAVQRRAAQAGVQHRTQDAVRGPYLPTGVLVQESEMCGNSDTIFHENSFSPTESKVLHYLRKFSQQKV